MKPAHDPVRDRRVSADVSTDAKIGQSYYTAPILVPEPERRRFVPGMPVEAYLQIGERSVLSYLMKPVSDQISKA